MNKEEIGNVIRQCRISAGFTQTELAERIGRPQQTIANWENGRSQPDANTLFELFHTLGVSVDNAFGFNPSHQSLVLSPDELSLVKDFRRLSSDGKEYILQTMAMALRSYEGKNDASSDLEKAN